MGEGEMFAVGLLRSPSGKEQGAQKGSFGLFFLFRIHSMSNKSAALLAVNCVGFDLLYAVAFFPQWSSCHAVPNLHEC